MKILYKTATGEIVSMGDLPTVTAGTGESVATLNGPIPSEPLNYYTFSGSSLVRKSQEDIDQMVLIQNFDFKQLWGTVWSGAISPTGLIDLPPYAKTIEDIWNYPNREGVYPYMQMLMSAGKGTSDDLAIIVAEFADQGIDITTIQ